MKNNKNNNDNIVMYNKNRHNKAPKKKKKIVLNASVVFFAAIFIYVVIVIIRSLAKDNLSVYEVRAGSITDKSEYTGIILRNEDVYYASDTGYINYYIRENSKVAVNNLIYTVDKDGKFNEMLENYIQQGQASLSADDLGSLKSIISSYMKDFKSNDFGRVYDINSGVMNELHKYIENKFISSPEFSSVTDGNFSQYYSEESGVISYYIDGYEGLTADKISSDSFSKKNYRRTCLANGKEIGLWDPVYKVVKNDKWSIVFIPDNSEINKLSSLDSVKVYFKYNDITAQTNVSLYHGADGKVYARLDFDRYMSEFLTDRFVDFEICYDEKDGLQIPVSSVVNKEVFKIPVQYAVYGGSGQTLGFLKETDDENGKTVEFVTGIIYKEDDFFYYVDCTDLELGDVIVKEGENGDHYEIAVTEVLDGVYCVNKGYAVFKRINIIGEKENYYIIQKGIRKGVSKYDHIALNGSEISENQIIY